MRKVIFMDLCEELGLRLQHQAMQRRDAILVQKWVVIDIWKLATPDCYRSVDNQFGIGQTGQALLAVLVLMLFQVGEVLKDVDLLDIPD